MFIKGVVERCQHASSHFVFLRGGLAYTKKQRNRVNLARIVHGGAEPFGALHSYSHAVQSNLLHQRLEFGLGYASPVVRF